MKFVPITYLIACFEGDRRVSGYAVRSQALPDWLHICVRRHGNWWRCDHYETGLSVGASAATRRDAVWIAITEYQDRCQEGRMSFQRALKDKGFGWLVPEGA